MDNVHLSILLPESERDAFDAFCRQKPRISMVAAARELFRLAATGKVQIDRDKARIRKGPQPKLPAPPKPKKRGK